MKPTIPARFPGWLRSSVGAPRRRPREAVALAFAVSVGAAMLVWFFVATDARGRTARLTADAWYYHAYLPSLVYDRDLDFTNEYRVTNNWYRFGKTEVGRSANVFGVGPAVYETPFFLIGSGISLIGNSERDGFSRPEVEASLLASPLFSLGALLFAYRLLRRRVGSRPIAVAVPLLILCASPVVYYAVRQPGYAHPFATFWVAWLVDYWDRSFTGDRPRSTRVWVCLGLLIGAASLARPQLALWASILLVAVADDVRQGRRAMSWTQLARTLAPRWALGAAVSLLVFSPQLLAWKAIYGSYLVVPQGPGFMRWDSPAWSEVWFASRNGLLPWSPLLALAALGLVVGSFRWPRLGLSLCVGVALQTLANGAVWDWWAGGSFGGRRFDSCFIAFAFGFASLFPSPGADMRGVARRLHLAAAGVVAAAAVLLAGANLKLASTYSAPTARIYGGKAAAHVIKKRVGGPLGGVASAFSWLSNLPAKAVFAFRFGRDLDAYDRLVGVHFLGELYPGLNSFKGKSHEALPLGSAPHGRGFEVIDKNSVRLKQERGELLVGLNRIGTVSVRGQAASPGTVHDSELVLRFNGAEVARATLSSTPIEIDAEATLLLRGINTIEVAAPPGTVLRGWSIHASEGANSRPRRNH